MANPKQLSNLFLSALHVNSTLAALKVHSVDESGAYVSAGAGSTQVSVKGMLTSSGGSVMDSTETALRVNVVAGAAGGSTTITVRQSTAADLTAAVVQGSTVWPVQVSSLAGVVAVQQNSTVWAIQADGRVRAQNSTIGDLLASVQQNSTVWQVQIPSSQSVQVKNSTAGDLLASVQQNSTVWAAQIDGRVRAQNSTIGDLLASVQQNSTVWAVQVDGRMRAQNSTIGDLLASVQQNSTVWQVQIPSTQSIQAKNSTIGDLLASVQQNSTVWQVQIPTSQSIQVKNSTIGDLLASVQQNSTVWQTQAAVRTSSGGAVEGSTTAPAVGVIGLHVRPVFPTMQSTTIVITSTHSTAIYPIVSSVAGLRHKVYAYFIGSTHMNPSTLIFCSSISNSGFDHWAVNFGSGSSGVTGANLALTPPGSIFGGVLQNALNIKIEGGSSVTATCVARVSLSWFDEA